MTADIEYGNPRNTPAWSALKQHAIQQAELNLSSLLSSAGRYASCSLQLDELICDFSRQLVTNETISLLTKLAEQQELPQQIDALFSGALVNTSEGRAALHTSLRGGSTGVQLDNCHVDAEVAHEQQRFLEFADAVRDGSHSGYGGARITTVINIGIGGSDLGPRMVSRALSADIQPVRVGFAAGLDGIELQELLRNAVPAETLFIVCSKTFTTLETRTNADAARAWLLNALPAEAVASNFAAVSVNDPALDEFGVATELRFRMWDWVGGRYSVWSAIGLAAAIAIGSDAYREMLAGAARMDEHFRTTDFDRNIPVISALLGIWNRNFLDNSQNVVLPYDQRLDLLPEYLQQLIMESLGKSVRQDGSMVDYATGAALWGGPGNPSQHSFSQWLHQGCAHAYVDYIGTVNGPQVLAAEGHAQAIANMIAQAEALSHGQSLEVVREGLIKAGLTSSEAERLAPQKVHPGNRPSTILMMKALSPRNLGMLLALYEHQVFVQAVIWGINPFDQWGVELGKSRAREYAAYLQGGSAEQLPGIGRQAVDWRKDSF